MGDDTSTCTKRGCHRTVRESIHLPWKMFCGEHFTHKKRYEQ